MALMTNQDIHSGGGKASAPSCAENFGRAHAFRTFVSC